jgi:exosortase B
MTGNSSGVLTVGSSTSQKIKKLLVSEWLPAIACFAVLFFPVYLELAGTLWRDEEQGHGPIILAIVGWFFWKESSGIIALESRPAQVWGWTTFITGLILFLLGRSQGILMLQIGSQIPVVAGLLLLLRGWAAVRALWFPLFFMIFMVPLPGVVVDTLTMPMKIGVSWATEHILYAVNYPISRSGVILQIGPYRLLVANACAGLHTLFTLEALGLFYLNIIRHASVFRNVGLAIFIVPVSFTANVIRVMTLTLITYHLGDEAGQGFLHGFAGMVLFLSALLLIIGVDSLLRVWDRSRHGK